MNVNIVDREYAHSNGYYFIYLFFSVKRLDFDNS